MMSTKDQQEKGIFEISETTERMRNNLVQKWAKDINRPFSERRTKTKQNMSGQ